MVSTAFNSVCARYQPTRIEGHVIMREAIFGSQSSSSMAVGIAQPVSIGFLHTVSCGKSVRSPAFRPQASDADPFHDAKRFRLKAGLRTAAYVFRAFLQCPSLAPSLPS